VKPAQFSAKLKAAKGIRQASPKIILPYSRYNRAKGIFDAFKNSFSNTVLLDCK